MKKLLLVVFLMVSPFSHAIELVNTEALNGKVALDVPGHFAPMTEELLEIKYPSSRRPTEVLSDESGSTTIALNYTQNPISDEQLPEAREAFSEMFENMYPSATWHKNQIEVVNGKKFIIFELVTPAIDTEIYNIMAFASVDDRLLLVSFNTTRELADEWVDTGKRIIGSIKIK